MLVAFIVYSCFDLFVLFNQMESMENQLWKKVLAKIQIDLKDMIVTYKTSTRILMSIIEFLAYNRNQIPLVYETFNLLATGLEKRATTDHCNDGIQDFAMERQRELVINTNQSFRNLIDIMAKTFKYNKIESCVICFGATLFTVKEAFVVNMPQISIRHSAQNHIDSLQTITRQVIMTIISSNQFFEANNSDLKITNMFILLKPKCVEKFSDDEQQFIRRDNFSFSSNCRTTILNIENNDENSQFNCCHDLHIYNKSPDIFAGMPNNKNQTESRHNADITIDPTYYECKIFIKGFKEQSIKGRSVWSL